MECLIKNLGHLRASLFQGFKARILRRVIYMYDKLKNTNKIEVMGKNAKKCVVPKLIWNLTVITYCDSNDDKSNLETN